MLSQAHSGEVETAGQFGFGVHNTRPGPWMEGQGRDMGHWHAVSPALFVVCVGLAETMGDTLRHPTIQLTSLLIHAL